MKNELKLNIIELLNNIDIMHSEHSRQLMEEKKGMNLEAIEVIKYNLEGEFFAHVNPLIGELKEMLQSSLIAAKLDQDKDELKKCIEFTKVFDTRANASYFGQVRIKVRDFKAYVDGLVENNEHIHRGSIGQGSSTKQGKEPSDQQDQDHKN